jgi:hypothetical protein
LLLPILRLKIRRKLAQRYNGAVLDLAGKIRLIPALMLALIPLAAQPAADTARIEGRVVNAATGEPVRKATIQLHTSPDPLKPRYFIEVTDANGRFAFADLPAGDLLLRGEKAGFGAPLLPGSEAVPMSRLSPGQAIRDIALAMVPHGVITGRVTDPDGDPVAGGYVRLYHVSGFPRQLSRGYDKTTDDQGRYRLIDVAPGVRYFVVAGARPLGAQGLRAA